MWYAIISEDVEDSLQKRLAVRDAHVARLREMTNKGRLLVAGPHPTIDAEDPGEAGYTGSLVVIDFPSIDDAQAWVDADPYVEAGVYAKVVIKPFVKVLP